MGYTRVRHFHGGIAAWRAAGFSLEGAAPHAPPSAPPSAGSRLGHAPARSMDRVVSLISHTSFGALLATWFWVAIAFGLLYWIADAWLGRGLQAGGVPVAGGWHGLIAAVYFSFVSALSVGYGDLVPVGPLRLFAIAEAAVGLILFGAMISKLVSRRQEELTQEIHRITFEDRLGRVRTNLHLVLSEMQEIAALCGSAGVVPGRVTSRAESVSSIFLGEARTIHDLLYRPQEAVEEDVLEGILASLALGMNQIQELRDCMPPGTSPSPRWERNMHALSTIARGICGDCVPREFAPGLKLYMDRIQELAEAIG